MKRCEVIVSCMYEKDRTILERMNIQSDAIIINQGDNNFIEEFDYKKNKIKFYSFKEKGVGLSRNTGLMRASKDFILFADEDEILENNYPELIEKEFETNKKADMILFNVKSLNKERPQFNIKKRKRVRIYNCGKYGAPRIALRTDSYKNHNVYFSLLFGGGAKYSNGEDSLFIHDCIKSGMKVYTTPINVGYVKQDKSTWFKGYNKKYFVDRAILYKKISKKFFYIICLRFLIKNYKLYKKDISFFNAFKYMIFFKKYSN